MLPPAFSILMKAALSARSSGAAEVGVKELLDVISGVDIPEKLETSAVDEELIPIPKYDVKLSATAAAAIASAGGLDDLSIGKLRSALLEASA